MNLGMVNCMRCRFRNEDNGNCTAVGGFCTAVPAAHCPLLRDYLDVGLMPDQVANAKVIIESAFTDDTSKAERIKEMLKADAEGRLVVLPCRVGDTVYEVTSRGTISEYEVRAIRTEMFGQFIDWRLRKGFVDRFCDDIPVGEIGKTVFLNREEAEKVLEAMKDV